MKPRILAFFPFYNEEDRLAPLLEKCTAQVDAGVIDEMLVVDDGSTDRSADVARKFAKVTLIQHPRNLGAGDGIRTAYHYALDHGFDVIVVFAGNGKDDPAHISRLVAPILADEADYVQGSRFLPGGDRRGLPLHRLVAMKTFTYTFSAFLLRWYTDCTNGFRAYRTSFLRDPRLDWSQEWLGHSYEIEFYMHYMAAALGYRVTEVPVSKVYDYAPGKAYSKVRIKDWLTNLKPLFLLRLGLRK